MDCIRLVLKGVLFLDDFELWARSLVAAGSPYAYIALEAVDVFKDIEQGLIK